MKSLCSLFNEAVSVACAVIVADAGVKIAVGTATWVLMAAGIPAAFAGLAFAAIPAGIVFGASIGYHGAKAVFGNLSRPVEQSVRRAGCRCPHDTNGLSPKLQQA